MTIRYLLFVTMRNVQSSIAVLLAASICLGVALFSAACYLERDSLASVYFPTWAKQTKALIAFSKKPNEKDLKEVIAKIHGTRWVKSYHLVEGKDVMELLKKKLAALDKTLEDMDPAFFPDIMELSLTDHCLALPGRCESFLRDLEKIRHVASVYSPLPWIKTAYDKLQVLRRLLLFAALLLSFVSLLMAGVGVQLSLGKYRKEAYLWNLLGASPWFMRFPCYGQVCLTFVVGVATAVSFPYWFSEIVCFSFPTLLLRGFLIASGVFLFALVAVAEANFRRARKMVSGDDGSWEE